MGIFSPIKKRANQFRYVPRYFDPEKERRDQRRKEMYGTSSQDDGEYTPGQYIRTQREARRLARANNKAKNRRPATLMLLLGGLALAGLVLYPRIVALYVPDQEAQDARALAQDEKALRKSQAADMREEREEALKMQNEEEAWSDKYRPITIVSNDYKEEEE